MSSVKVYNGQLSKFTGQLSRFIQVKVQNARYVKLRIVQGVSIDIQDLCMVCHAPLLPHLLDAKYQFTVLASLITHNYNLQFI